jgi:hypothetical protein
LSNTHGITHSIHVNKPGWESSNGCRQDPGEIVSPKIFPRNKLATITCMSLLHLCVFHWKSSIFLPMCSLQDSLKALYITHGCLCLQFNLIHTGKILESMYQSIEILYRPSQYAAGEDCSTGWYRHIKLALHVIFLDITTQIRHISEIVPIIFFQGTN